MKTGSLYDFIDTDYGQIEVYLTTSNGARIPDGYQIRMPAGMPEDVGLREAKIIDRGMPDPVRGRSAIIWRLSDGASGKADDASDQTLLDL
jgi:hypothetical protein